MAADESKRTSKNNTSSDFYLSLKHVILKEYITITGVDAVCEFRSVDGISIIKHGDEVWFNVRGGFFIVPWSSVLVAVPLNWPG